MQAKEQFAQAFAAMQAALDERNAAEKAAFAAGRHVVVELSGGAHPDDDDLGLFGGHGLIPDIAESGCRLEQAAAAVQVVDTHSGGVCIFTTASIDRR